MPVDDSATPVMTSTFWLGWVVPKRHARRAVTRTLLKRQIRVAFERHAAALPGGLWLVRLRAPFAPTEFISARSALLAAAARTELDRLLAGTTG
jgi:ribonuclease P protein component